MAAAAIGVGITSSSSLHFFQKLSPQQPKSFKPQSLSVSTPKQRRSANYMPNLWNHDYIEASITKDTTKESHGEMFDCVRRAEELKEHVRSLLVEEQQLSPVALLELVDQLRRLGVDYHFKEEIKGVMGSIWNTSVGTVLSEKSLYSTSLMFRLLREHLFEISQDVFDAFKDKNSNYLSSTILNDTEVLLSLYEASFMAFEGEETLKSARIFTREHLKKHLLNPEINPIVKETIIHALELPMNLRVPRLQVRWFLELQERKKTIDRELLEFSKLDFNILQSVHRRELNEASRWWNDLGLAGKLSFCRDRVVENYFCVLGGHCEPEFWEYRQKMTKIFCLIATIDDTYDIYGTLEELQTFTGAVVRWDVKAIEGLPECMKLCFLALFNTVNEIAYDHLKQKGQDISSYLRKTWAQLCKAWLVEAKWYHNKEDATFEEYMSNSWVSMGWTVVCVHGYFLVTQQVTKEALEQHLDISDPDIIRFSSTLIRLWNDLSTSQAELERGDIRKSIQCYMVEKSVSYSEARDYIQSLVDTTWNKLNRSRYESVVFGEEFLNLVMDGTRILHFIYYRGDGYAKPDKETKDSIMSLLFDPIC